VAASAARKVAVPVASHSEDLESSMVSEGQPVSGESEPVSESESSTPRATTPLDDDRSLSNHTASSGSQVNPKGIRSEDVQDRTPEVSDDEDDVSLSGRSDKTESDDGVVIKSSRPPSQLNNGQVSNDAVRVVVSHVSLNDGDLLRDDKVKMLYVEYYFLGIPLEETETPCALAKPTVPGKQIVFNFSKLFPVDVKKHMERRRMLAAMIVPGHPDNGRLRFSLVSEPQDDDDEECVDVGIAFVSIPDILKTGRDVINKEIPIYSKDNETTEIGVLGVTVECLKALQAVKKELPA
jgi:hypothetical protein